MNLRRLTAVAWKEWREIVRDRMFFTLAFVIPSVFVLLFGYGLSTDVEHLPLVIVDRDHSRLSRELAYRYIGTRYFDFRGYVDDERAVTALLMDGTVRAAIVIPDRFEERLLAGRPVAVQTLIDGIFPSRAQVAKSYVIAINAAFSADLLTDYVARADGVPADAARRLIEPVRLDVRYLYNQDLQSLVAMAPKLLMVVLLMAPPLLTAVGVVREKESGSIYNIYSSTVTRLEFLVGKLLPYGLISLVNAVILFAWVRWLFGSPFKGSLLFLAGTTTLYVICTTAIGVLISVFVRTQVAAIVVTTVVTMIPAYLYSGLLIPIRSLDPATQVFAHMLPAMYYNEIVLGAFLKGVGLETLWPETLVLGGYAVGLVVLAYLLFHKRVPA